MPGVMSGMVGVQTVCRGDQQILVCKELVPWVGLQCVLVVFPGNTHFSF